MNTKYPFWFACAIFFALLGTACGQGFINDYFENTTITPPLGIPGSSSHVATVPGWTSIIDGVTNDLGSNPVYYNNFALDSAAVSLQGTGSPIAGAPIDEQYSLYIQGGSIFSGQYSGTNGTSVFQTGQIPVTAKSIYFQGGSALQASFNGQQLLKNAFYDAGTYIIWDADISAFAGQTGQLVFTVPWQSSSLLDDVEFSSNPVPEPGALSLFAAGALLFFFGWRRIKPSKQI
jgi:hypothetical protein